MLLFHLPLPFHLLFFFSHIPCTSLSQTSTHGVAFPHSPLPAVAAAGPILQGRPFVVVWNMPTAQCQKRYNIHLDLGDFDIVENRQQRFQGQVIVLRGYTAFSVDSKCNSVVFNCFKFDSTFLKGFSHYILA